MQQFDASVRDCRRKAALVFLLGLTVALAPFLLFELAYRYALSEVEIARLPRSDAPMLLQNALWVAAGEHVGAGVKRAWLGNLWPTDWRHRQLPPGYRAADRLVMRSTVHRVGVRLFAAVWLTRHSTEEELKSAFTATSYFGRGARGPRAASAAFFGKPPEELSVAEIATLAAQLQQPTRDPYCHDELSMHRDWVIERMRAESLIDAKQAADAKAESPHVLPVTCRRPGPGPEAE